MPLTQLLQHIQAGRYLAASQELTRLLSSAPLSTGDFARACHYGSVLRFRTDKIHGAVSMAELAEKKATEAGDGVLLGTVWSNLVEFCRLVGDFPRALEYGEKWLANIKLYPELAQREGQVHYNMALVHRSRKNPYAAMQHLKAAQDLMRLSCAPRSHRVACHQMYAWTLYEQGQYDAGDEQVRLAADLLEPDDQTGHVEQILLGCLRAYRTGNYEEARLAAEEILTASQWSATTSAQAFWAIWIMGMCYCQVGKLDVARQMSILARDQSLKTGEPEHMNRTIELVRKIEGIRGTAG